MIKPYWQQDGNAVYHGDALEVLRTLPDESVHCCVTSPPYWGLRDYGLLPIVWGADPTCQHKWLETEFIANKSGGASEIQQSNIGAWNPDGILSKHSFCQLCGAWRGCLGLEPTPELYIKHMVEIFREAKRILRKDGTLFLNIGDSYAGSGSPGGDFRDGKGGDEYLRPYNRKGGGLKPKDLCGVPWRVALALQSDGWWLRQDIILSKRNPMPESVTDRCTKSHEYMFLLTKSSRYFYDAEAIKEDSVDDESYLGRRPRSQGNMNLLDPGNYKFHGSVKNGKLPFGQTYPKRNKRSVWEYSTQPFSGAHFATFSEPMILPCILAGTSERGCCSACGKPVERVVEKKKTPRNELSQDDPRYRPNRYIKNKYADELREGYECGMYSETKTTGWQPGCKCNAGTKPCVVLDPFGGSCTTAVVAHKHGRKFVMVELSETYIKDIAIPRIVRATRQMRMF